MTGELIGIIVLLLLSGFFSSSELAFVVANKLKLEIRARNNKLTAKSAFYFIKNPQIFFATILISNNVINIAFASLATVFLYEAFQLSDYQILILSSTLLLLFGELIPKYLAKESADGYVLLAAIPIRIITFVLYPFVKITSSIASALVKDEKLEKDEISYLFDREDIQSLLTESTKAGHVQELEYDILNKIIDLKEQKVYEAMTPRIDITGVDIDSSIEDALTIFITSGYSKLPVYEENLDNIKGMIIAYDMFKKPDSIGDVIRQVIYVPETKRSLEMLNEFLDKQISIAIVVDEFGGTAGVITVEDIIEEMLGEIRDEFDAEEEICKQIDKNTYVIGGKVEIDYINEEFELNIPEGDFETIGGYITSITGNIPVKGEQITIDHFIITIVRSSKTKIDLVRLTVDQQKLEELSL